MESITPILEFKKTCISYTPQTMAVKYVSAAIQKNTITAIMGPSGSGKTTLLNLLSTIDKPTKGEILLNGKDITRLKNKELSQLLIYISIPYSKHNMLFFLHTSNYLLHKLHVQYHL